MGDLLKEELLDLIRRFNAQLNAKMSNIIALFLNHKNGSIGAIAGLAIAFVFTWRYLKAPVGRPRRLEKPRNSSSATTSDNSQSAGESNSSSGACLPCSSLNEYGVSSQEFTTPLPLSLAQVVRQQLNGGRKVTCQLLGVILEESTPEDLQKHAVVRPSVVDVLLEIAKSCDLYLIARVLDDQSEEKVISALDAVGVFTIGGLNRNKVLFCSTEAGRSSFVRQLEPDWHIDTNSEIISQLARFIRYQLHISTFGVGYIASNVFGSDSLEHYFGCLEKN
ncbi:hypothetical protein SUGI_0393890 [Cryptomeria japonica]|uniref:peroxisome biogenesis protein 22 n=1 Tax=Cryptomeria japonica TaxID=3369 RepID=UPI002408DB44|nr:peroxisome biogenesis protein 22 [Cryptomeria japonica]GLJ21394.1 hypothetical protein SUGI_0393890 [Cryptomeria japonica]